MSATRYFAEAGGRLREVLPEVPGTGPDCVRCARGVGRCLIYQDGTILVECHGVRAEFPWFARAARTAAAVYLPAFGGEWPYQPCLLPSVPPSYFLTVREPWAWALAQGHKPVENRTRPPPRRALGAYVALHAGLADAGPEAHSEVARLTGRAANSWPRRPGYVLAVARLVGWAEVVDGVATLRAHAGHRAEVEALLQRGQPWLNGSRWAWVFEAPRQVPPSVKLRGNLGLQPLSVLHAMVLHNLLTPP